MLKHYTEQARIICRKTSPSVTGRPTLVTLVPRIHMVTRQFVRLLHHFVLVLIDDDPIATDRADVWVEFASWQPRTGVVLKPVNQPTF